MLFKSYRVDKNLRPAAAAAAYEPVQKHKVTPGIPGWLNNLEKSCKDTFPPDMSLILNQQ